MFINNNDIVICMRLLFPTVKVFLLAWIGWSLTLAFGPINNKIVQRTCFQGFLQFAWIAFWKAFFNPKRTLYDWTQDMNPCTRLRLAYTKDYPHC